MKIFFALSMVMTCLCSMAQSSNSFTVEFKPGQTTLGDKQKQAVNEAASKLKDGAVATFLPLVYDSTYDQYKFTQNAKEQAQAIADYAATCGFKLIGMPRNFPSSFSGLSIGVNMRYSKPAEMTAQTQIPAPKPETLDAHYPDKPSQFFIINPLRDTVVYGLEGTKLQFKAGSLLSKKPVKVELKEYYKLEDYLKNGLTTSSNGQLIQSGGSIYLNAKDNNNNARQIGIDQKIGVGVDFTMGKSDTAMLIFIKDPKVNDRINWVLPKTRQIVETWQMTETVIGPDGKVISKKNYNKEEWAKHQEEEKAKEEEARKKAEEERKKAEEESRLQTARNTTDMNMQSKLRIYDLGYINCDKFYKEPKTSIQFAADTLIGTEYYLVYTDIRGILKGDVSGKDVFFEDISQNRTATLLVVSIVNKQAYFFTCQIDPLSKSKPKIKLVAVSDAYLDQQLAVLK